MAKQELTPEDIKNYRKDLRHIFYKKSCELSKDIKVHADGLFPDALLTNRRPNEPSEVLDYRKVIYIAKTKAAFTKVFSSLQKIRRSGDWNIDYQKVKKEDYPGIAQGEDMYSYCEENFPYFKSVTNWIFNLELRKYMIDSNAVVLVMPLKLITESTQYVQPFPIIYDSEDVLDYKEEDFCVLRNPLGATYISDGTIKTGDSYFFVNDKVIQRWDQINGRGNFELKYSYEHNLGFLPAKKLGGVYIDQATDDFLFESRISGMIPELDEALREYSDLQAAVVLHIYPEPWRYTNVECPTCQGKMRVPNPAWYDGCSECGPQFETCGSCHGTGVYKSTGPYNMTLIKPNNAAVGDTGSIPTPPGGFFEKDVEIVKLQDTRVDNHIYNAYAAINFEFLANTPLVQSGVAKVVDKDELNNTVNAFAEDIVATMDFVYKCIAAFRYGFKYPDSWEGLLPAIAVPVNYDLLSGANAQASLSAAKTAGANPVILNALEAEYASKVFYSNPEIKDALLLELNLDPLPNVAEADKILRLTNKGIDQITYVISSNIHEFVQRAQEEEKDFVTMDPEEQKEILAGYAQEIIDSTSPKRKIILKSANGLYPEDQVVDEEGNITPASSALDPNFNKNFIDPNKVGSYVGLPRYSAVDQSGNT